MNSKNVLDNCVFNPPQPQHNSKIKVYSNINFESHVPF